MQIRVRYQSTGAPAPEYASDQAAGADLRAKIPQELIIPPGGRTLIPTGLRLHIPDGVEGQIRPRSGLALHRGVTVLNTPGTIDADYRGEISVILINLGAEPARITPGERIAQIIFAPVARAHFVPTEKLDITERGGEGFGSTGT